MKVLSIFIFLVANVFGAQYKLDVAHTIIEFKVKHLVISTVKGHFAKFDGEFEVDETKRIVLKRIKKIEKCKSFIKKI